ncbi:MAG: ComEC/Rec2 family competence protein [Verrucomicrobiales bacterium]
MSNGESSVVPGPHRQPKLGLVALVAMVGVVFSDRWTWMEPSAWCLAVAVAVAWFGRRDTLWALLWVVVAVFGMAHSLDRAARAAFPFADRLAEGEKVEVMVVGVVTDAPVASGGDIRFPLKMESVRTVDGGWRVRATSLAHSSGLRGAASTWPGCGDRIQVWGWLEAPRPARNPGQFDAASWFEREGMAVGLRATRYRVADRAAAMPMKRWAMRVRGVLAAAITRDLGGFPEEASVIRALVLGGREGMSEEADEAFIRSGTLHIFSVSGLHVGFVALIIWRVLNLLRFRRRPAAWVSIPLVFFYALVTGWQSAAVRSAVMAAVMLLGIGLDRRPAFFNSLCLAALLLLAVDTQQLFRPGTQLSFVVIGAIAAGGHSVARWLLKWGEPDPFLPRLLWSRSQRWGRMAWGWLAQMLAVSLVAGLGSTPLTLWYFHLATPVSLIANLLHVPLAALILSTAALGAACHPWWLAAGSVFAHANAAFARVCLMTAGWFAAQPGGSVAWNPRLLTEPADACRITIFDAGDGGAVLIRTPHGKSWLLDTGDVVTFERVVRPGLAYFGIDRLDGLILSHGDHDHVGGAVAALERFGPRVVGHAPHPTKSPGWRDALARGIGQARPLRSGDRLGLDESTSLTVLWPPDDSVGTVADDGCLVLVLECAGRSVLISNDAGFLAERSLGRQERPWETDIWIRGRHASDLFGLPEFIDRLQPALVVCSGREKATAASVPEEWRARVEAGGAQVIAQSESGAVDLVIKSDGTWSHREFLNGAVRRRGNLDAPGSRAKKDDGTTNGTNGHE